MKTPECYAVQNSIFLTTVCSQLKFFFPVQDTEKQLSTKNKNTLHKKSSISHCTTLYWKIICFMFDLNNCLIPNIEIMQIIMWKVTNSLRIQNSFLNGICCLYWSMFDLVDIISTFYFIQDCFMQDIPRFLFIA